MHYFKCIYFFFHCHSLLKNHNVSQRSYKVLQHFATGSSLSHPANFLMVLFTLFPTADIDLKENRHHVVQFFSVIASPLTFSFSCGNKQTSKQIYIFLITYFRSKWNKMEIKTLTNSSATPTCTHMYILPIIPLTSAC